MGDMVDAVAHHQSHRAIAGAKQRREVLAGEIGGERPPVGGPVKLAAPVLDGRPNGDELSQVGAPFVAPDVEPDAHDPVGAELICLLLHARHRELSGVVHRLGQNAHLLVLIPHRLLEADVVDRAAEHQAERLESRLLDEQELIDRQIAGEEAARRLLLHPFDAFAPGLGNPLERSRLVSAGVRCLRRRRALNRGRLLDDPVALRVLVPLQKPHVHSSSALSVKAPAQ